jgi:hypothetical protein
MDTLKNISFSIALFIIGAIFILLGLSGGFTFSNYALAIQDVWSRIVAITIGVVLSIVAIYMETKMKSAGEKTLSGKTVATKDTARTEETAKQVPASSFFFTLDDKQVESFPDMVKDAVRIQILGRTSVNLLGQYEREFERLGKDGCEIQLLFVDPLSDASKFLYGSNPEIYKNNIISASQHLKKMKQILGTRLTVKTTKHAPTCSTIVIEKQDMQSGFVQVQLYFLHSAIGRDRPIFRVNYGDKWYGIFRDEFAKLWVDSVDWDVSKFLENISKGDN